MPFFGKSKKRSDSASVSSAFTTPTLPPFEPFSPPPYQFFADPPPQQSPYPHPSPYSYPQPSTTSLALRPAFTPCLNNGPWIHHPHKQTSCLNLPAPNARPIVPHSTVYLSPNYLYDYIGDRFSDVVSLIDEEIFTGGEKELIINLGPVTSPYNSPPLHYAQPVIRGGVGNEKALWPSGQKPQPREKQHTSSQERSINVISKVSLYANSRLPTNLPPLQVYMPSWPLICHAARYSNNAYKRPVGAERETFVSPDTRTGTKAMVIKSVPIDNKNLIVFAIRGTSLISPRDWGVNLSTTPVPPTNFLDDSGNLCHEGFLRVARAMVRPIAARLRHLLEENPSRAKCSLLITGHSAGGAVAALLYSHMLCETVQSELNILTNCFKRIHCITFGAPPVTLLPLWKPVNSERRLQKSLFLSFINEGDVVSRAELPYMYSLVKLLASPAPNALRMAMNAGGASSSRLDLSKKPRHPQRTGKAIWKLPPATFSNPGRLVLLQVPEGKTDRTVSASIVTDAQLREVIFGDPLIHQMHIYARRIEVLATRAVTGGGIS